MNQDATSDKFVTVTEVAGEEVSREQVERLCARYYWASSYCRERDVVEIACGSGQGLGYLSGVARSVSAGDISEELLSRARAHYGKRIEIEKVDAASLPYADKSKDVILLFEAIYYLPDVEKFLEESTRVLREGGHLLIATCNKDLFGFNPSPFSHRYYGVVELKKLLEDHGYAVRFFGNTPMHAVSWRQRALQPVKKLVVGLNLMPKTMAGKKLLKRLVFGQMVSMPAEVTEGMAEYEPPTLLDPNVADSTHKAIFCEARLKASH